MTSTKKSRNLPSKCIHKVGKTTIDLLNPPHPKSLMDMINLDGKPHIIPSRATREQPKLFDKKEFDRLKTEAHVVTAAEKIALMEKLDKEKQKKEMESSIRKEKLMKAQQEQELKEGKKLTIVEAAAKKQSAYLLQRAFDLQQEQQDEVKYANGLILASKCLAIRAAQVNEKELIKKELEEENNRLDQMMEEQRRKSLQEEDEKRKENHIKNQKFVKEMMEQIREKEIEKLMDAERIDEEARLQNRAIIQMQLEEEEKRQKLIKKQEKMRADLVKGNLEIEKYKQTQKEESRIAELRVQEFMRKKAEREEAVAEELRQQKAAKEEMQERLRAAQGKEADLAAARDEMNAIRVQEEVEKAWRIKEKAAAEKKRRENENLKEARRKQIEDIRKQQAVELQREKEDFYKIVKVQKEYEIIEKEKELKKKEQNLKHRKEILLQVNEKEREKINQRKLTFEEGFAIKAEKELRENYIKQSLKKKISTLRANKVPESVVKDIERQLKL